MLVVHSQVLSPFLHTQSPSILSPSPSTTRTTNFFFFFFVSVRSTISTLSLFLLQYTHYYTRAFSLATNKEKSVLIREGDEPSLSLIRSYYQLVNNCGGRTDISFLHVHRTIQNSHQGLVSGFMCHLFHGCMLHTRIFGGTDWGVKEVKNVVTWT